MNKLTETKGYTIWLTGLSGSGKTTIAVSLVEILRNRNIPVILLDGDEIRKTISSDLGFSKEERDKHIYRVYNISNIISKNEVLNIVSVISPNRKIRNDARKLIENFIEIYVKCPIDICIKRNTKGLYNKKPGKKINNVVGLDIKYEEPLNPDIVVETDKSTVSECVNLIVSELEKRKII